MSRGFTVTEFAAATLIGLPLLIIGIQIMPGLMKVSAKATEAGIATMLIRNTWNELRAQVRTESGFDIDYTAVSTYASPYANYKLSTVDTTTNNLKQLTLTVWHDQNNDGLYGSGEIGYVTTGYLGRHTW